MKKNIIICGLIAGLIVTVVIVFAMAKLFSLQSATASMVFTYTTMLMAFSLIFVAIKNSRDKYGDGTITFGKAFGIGLMVALIASTMYVVVWMIDYKYFMPDFYGKYAAHELVKMKAAGASQAALQAKMAEIQWYKNPFVIALMTYMEILPVGLIVSILAAVILKRKTAADEVIITN